MRTLSVALVLLFSNLLSNAILAAPSAEVRGTWLTTTANDALATPAQTAQTMRKLREIGLNTVYVECWKNGYTEFPSATLQKIIEVTHKVNAPNQPPSTNSVQGPTRDLLGETILEAHRNQLLHFAWFEYGFMCASKDTDNELRRTRPQWLLRDKGGNEVAPDGMVWMNPVHPEVRAFLLGIIVEALNKYDLDGVQLDDRLAWPDNSMGYDDYTKSAYAKDHQGGPPPTDPNNAEWVRWRAEKVSDFAKEFFDAVRKARPDVLVSLSPSPYLWSVEHHDADWSAWANHDLMDEFVPQVYRDSYARFADEWPKQVDAVGPGRRGDLVAGLRIVGDGRDTPWDDLQKMCDLVRQTGGGGHCWWFSRGVLDVYPQPIAAYYAVGARGYAARPKRDENWRPPPIEGEKRGEHWSVKVDTPGMYQIIIKKDGIWSPTRIEHAQRGAIDLHDQHYEAVELLVDRRARH